MKQFEKSCFVQHARANPQMHTAHALASFGGPTVCGGGGGGGGDTKRSTASTIIHRFSTALSAQHLAIA